MLKPEQLLAENIRALLTARQMDQSALAVWCGHKTPWISKILAGDRGCRIKELGKIADFFGLTVAELFQPGLTSSTERRVRQRRVAERRTRADRRSLGHRDRGLHPDVQPPFRSSDHEAAAEVRAETPAGRLTLLGHRKGS